MKIAVSACLLGKNCKYNGGNNYSKKVSDYIKGHEAVPVCPEVLGGLSTPREPAEIVNGRVSHKDGTSVDKEFRQGAETALRIVKERQIDLVILQARSPSCGVNTIYDGSFSGKIIPGQGVFAELLKKNGIKVIDAEDL
jgi:purine nucleoside phosphorylase